MKFSKFGSKFTGESAIVPLMDDLGDALRVSPELLFMGGGNPARIPEVEAEFRRALEATMQSDDGLHNLLGIYQSPQGDGEVIAKLANYLSTQFAWPITEKNITFSNGSQSAFFVLFNLFAGEFESSQFKRVLLPVVPEYVGYADSGLSEEFFVANKPDIETIDEHTFKYRVNFDTLDLQDNIGALCVSRPTNPSGNVLTDEEISRLDVLAAQFDIPLIIDGAYGMPFPNIVFSNAKPYWSENTILVLSLSKLGLPGARTGIVIAQEKVIRAFSKANTILSLAAGNLGPVILDKLLDDNKITALSNDLVKPFYQGAANVAERCVRKYFADLPYAIHQPEGAMFLWVWFKGLPISSQELYERLKRRGLLVLAGEHFFVGLKEDWPHQFECIRISYCQSAEVIEKGIQMIAEEVTVLY
ncbi:valine--pyruvate transaminase [Aurantivibrio infirmus]